MRPLSCIVEAGVFLQVTGGIWEDSGSCLESLHVLEIQNLSRLPSYSSPFHLAHGVARRQGGQCCWRDEILYQLGLVYFLKSPEVLKPCARSPWSEQERSKQSQSLKHFQQQGMVFQPPKKDESVSLCSMSGGHFSAKARRHDTSLE